jgi:excisionase family DNA binding protein
MDQKILYRPEEGADALAVSRARMYELIASGEVESIKIGRSRRISRTALEQYVERLRLGDTGPSAA